MKNGARSANDNFLLLARFSTPQPQCRIERRRTHVSFSSPYLFTVKFPTCYQIMMSVSPYKKLKSLKSHAKHQSSHTIHTTFPPPISPPNLTIFIAIQASHPSVSRAHNIQK